MITCDAGPPLAVSANDAPVGGETTVTDLPVTGKLPPELDGCYVRIGPNPVQRPDPGRYQPFTGDGMMHGVRLRGGRAEWYRSRWVRSSRVSQVLGEPEVPGPRRGPSDNANVNVIRHGGRTLALGEAGTVPMEVGADLRTLARADFDGTLPRGFTAHPECDPVTGELFAAAYYHEAPYVQYLIVDVTGRVRHAAPISVKNAPMMHALSLTERHVVLYDLPVTFNPAAAAAGWRFPYTWDPDHGARLGVLPREGGDADVRWLEIEPCYVFHPLNAYERGDEIVIEVVRHDRVFDRDLFRPAESAGTLWRWTVDRVSWTVREEQLDDIAEEFPRMDDRCKGSPHRYGYAVVLGRSEGTAFAGPSLVKHDLALGRTEVRELGRGWEAGEAVFVPRAPQCAEDDGWLITFVYDAAADTSQLAVLNADDFTGRPQAVVHLPGRVPHGFHASWLAAG